MEASLDLKPNLHKVEVYFSDLQMIVCEKCRLVALDSRLIMCNDEHSVKY